MKTNLGQAIIDLRRESSSKQLNGAQTLTRLYFHPEFHRAIPDLRHAAENASDSMVKLRSAEALVLAGDSLEKQLPVLTEFLSRDYNAETRLAAFQAIGHVGPSAVLAIPILLPFLKDDDQEIQKACFETLTLLRPSGDVVVNILKALGEDVINRKTLENWLTIIGRSIVPDLIELLKTPGSRDRRIAIEVLCEIGWAPFEAAELVLNSLIEDDCWNSFIRRSQLFSHDRRLECFFWFDEPDDVLGIALQHPHVEIRRLATYFIANLHTKTAGKYLAKLFSALEDADEEVTRNALNALMRMARNDDSLWPQLLPQIQILAKNGSRFIHNKLLDSLDLVQPIYRLDVLKFIAQSSSDEGIRGRIKRSLCECEPDIALRVDHFVEILERDEKLDFDFLRKLRKLGLDAVSAIPHLMDLIGRYQGDSHSRSQLALAIAQIAPDHKVTRSLLADSDLEVQNLTLAGMCESDYSAEFMIPILKERLFDNHFDVRFVARELWKRSNDVEAVISALLWHLSRTYVYECKEREIYFGASLASLGKHWHESIDFVVDIARSHVTALPYIARELCSGTHPHINLIRLQWRIFRNPEKVIPELTAMLNSRSSLDLSSRTAAIELLFQMGVAARKAIRTLEEQLEETYGVYRSHALQALGRIGTAAESSIREVAQIFSRGTLAKCEAPDQEPTELELDQCRILAAETLGELLPELRSNVPTLKLLAGNAYVREAIGWVAENESIASLKVLLKSITARFGHVNVGVYAPPIVVDNQGDSVDVPALAQLLFKLPEKRYEILLALGLFGAHAASATAEIVTMLDEDSIDVRDEAICVLAGLGRPAVEELKVRLRSHDWIVRLEAAETLHQTGCLAAGELPCLLDLLAGADLNETILYKRSLTSKTHRRLLDQIDEIIDGEKTEHYTKVLPLLASIVQGGGGLADCALYKIRHFGQTALPLLPLVIASLDSTDRYLRYSAVCVIPALIQSPSERVEFLRPRLNDPEPLVYNAALGEIAEVDPSILEMYSQKE